MTIESQPDGEKLRDGEFPLPDLASLSPDGRPDYNRLIFTSSPYLLQHARNPVDWWPWCDDAFEKARREDKPVFLSIGYSTCHWCHVMEHESFEDADVAAYLNAHFVSIKVDREERPDIDHIYMTVCQAMTGSGGWPLTVFLTPAGQPFYAGTYFPKGDRWGRPGFLRVIRSLHDAWNSDRARIADISEEVSAHLSGTVKIPGDMPADVFERAERQFSSTFDAARGGFGGAPKFPMPHALSFLLRRFERSRDASILRMAAHTLDAMYRGGINDHVGFGFCRYSTDAQWLVPHFEKMLYDNALLLAAYADAFQVTRTPAHERAAREIVSYLQRELTDPLGGFYSAENADSEGEEGKFYVFSYDTFLSIVGGEHGVKLAEYFGVTVAGNFEHGTNILHIAVDPAGWRERHGLSDADALRIIGDARARLFAARAQRVHPSLDDKVLTSWNGLMIAALARAARAFGDAGMAALARRAADFLLETMHAPDGGLLHRWRRGEAGIGGFLEDYAFFTWGLVELYETTLETAYLAHAIALARRMLRDFHDEEDGGLFFTSADAERLIVRTKDVYDGALPSGNSVAALVLLRLARMTGEAEFDDAARAILRTFGAQAQSAPTGHTMLLAAHDFATGPVREIVIAAPTRAAAEPLLDRVRARFMPRAVVLLHLDGEEGESLRALAPFVADKIPLLGRAAAYVCENHACALPVSEPSELDAMLAG